MLQNDDFPNFSLFNSFANVNHLKILHYIFRKSSNAYCTHIITMLFTNYSVIHSFPRNILPHKFPVTLRPFSFWCGLQRKIHILAAPSSRRLIFLAHSTSDNSPAGSSVYKFSKTTCAHSLSLSLIHLNSLKEENQ